MREKLGVLNLEVIPYRESPEYVDSGWIDATFTLTSKELIFTFEQKHAIIPIESITEIRAIPETREIRVRKGCIAIGYSTKKGEYGYALLRGPELLVSALRCALIVMSGKETKVEQPLTQVERGLVLLLYLNVRNKKTQEFLLATFGNELKDALGALQRKGYIDEESNLTPKGIKFLKERETSAISETQARSQFTFPDAARMFGMSIVLEAKMRHFIKTMRVPRKELRKFFENPEKSELFDFLKYYIKKMGVGDISIEEFTPFKLVIAVENNAVPEIYIAPRGSKSCFVLSHFLYRVFSECFGISASVEETGCVSEGKKECRFRVELQPLNLYLTILSMEDAENLIKIDTGKEVDEGLVKFYEELKLVKDNRLSENGKIFLRYTEHYGIEKWEDFPPPWHTEKIDPRIALDPEFKRLFEESWKRIRE
ncbi:MAG: hypothetical protein N3F63_04040 [Thermoplasmata archaeon]|nr:hypothetical protein [Thermoplasmata archaeon]